MRVPAIAACAFALAFTACDSDDDGDLAASRAAIDVDAFELPPSSASERARIVHDYDLLDPDDLVPRGMLEDAIGYYDINAELIPQHDYVVVVDLSRYSGEDRFWLVDLGTGDVEPHKVAHGDGSDQDNDGYATLFGNVEGSHMSSLGFALTGEIYDGTHVHSMRLDGLSPDGSPNGMANTNIRDRLIVVHEASYVDDSNDSQQGRSNGCLALDPSIEVGVVDRIHDGSLVYSAIDELNAPVGRAVCGDALCDGDENDASCPADCDGTEPGDGGFDDASSDFGDGDGGGEAGGCSTGRGGGAGSALLALALLGLGRRSRSS
jgi:hypothetical protein